MVYSFRSFRQEPRQTETDRQQEPGDRSSFPCIVVCLPVPAWITYLLCQWTWFLPILCLLPPPPYLLLYTVLHPSHFYLFSTYPILTTYLPLALCSFPTGTLHPYSGFGTKLPACSHTVKTFPNHDREGRMNGILIGTLLYFPVGVLPATPPSLPFSTPQVPYYYQFYYYCSAVAGKKALPLPHMVLCLYARLPCHMPVCCLPAYPLPPLPTCPFPLPCSLPSLLEIKRETVEKNWEQGSSLSPSLLSPLSLSLGVLLCLR